MTLFNLEKRVAFITGGNGGIGLGMAKGFASSDAAVVIAGEIEQRPNRRCRSCVQWAPQDVQDMFRIQMEFMRTQMEAFAKQANSLGDAYIKAASGQTNKPPP
jgi:NAD(P)-dependent dehydrogenase (short-subunit alcohol dehydrogenase family)